MIVLLALAAWSLSLAAVTALCMAARRGDQQGRIDAHAGPVGDPAPSHRAVRHALPGRSPPPARRDAAPLSDARGRGGGAEEHSSHDAKQPADLALAPG